jgi:ABC-type uncharacterized transport system auxiliary subunit
MKSKILMTILLLPLFYRCGGSIPDMHYYLIDYTIPTKSDMSQPAHQIVLGVARFEAAPLYKEERLVYRDSPYEGKYYHYHRWITSPEQMISEQAIEQLKASNLFEQVLAFPKYSQVDFILQGTIKALEEWDEGDQWYARVQIAFDLLSATENQIVWQKTVERKEKISHKTPAEVVKVINLDVQQCINDIEKDLDAFFAGS